MILATDPGYLEIVANDPRVFPKVSVRGQDRIDLGCIWDRCVACQFEGGGFIFLPHGEGDWEVHVMFLPKSKGVFLAGIEAFRYVFEQLGAEQVAARLPDDVPAAKRLAVRLGFQFDSYNEPFPRQSGDVPSSLYLLSRERFNHVHR